MTVTDVNEFSPVFDPTTPYTATVSEDATIGHTVKDVGATDSDFSDTVLTYSIASGNSDLKFTLDSVSGVLQVQNALNRELVSSYTLTLTVADGSGAGSRTATTPIYITVSDVNDNDPSCSPAAYVASVAESASIATSVTSLTCSDVDTSTSILSYTLLSGNVGSAFAVDSGSGRLTVNAALDYETLTEYSLLVEVSDQGTVARKISVPVTVSVTPVNEMTPTFPAGGYGNTDVSESASVGTSVLTVSATDGDRGLLHGKVVGCFLLWLGFLPISI